MGIEYKIARCSQELQKAFCVRHIVFIEEQGCPYELEHDQFDFSSTHFLGDIAGEPVCTARVRLYKGAVKVERFAVRKQWRGHGVGAALFRFILAHLQNEGIIRVVLNAQVQATGFYEKFGFVKSGGKFLEAGIEHYRMEKVL